MTSTWSNSIEKNLFLISKLPDSLQGKLIKAFQQHYEELYEPEATAYLQDAIDDILTAFQSNDPKLTHLRYVWMALIFAVVVEPTVKYYQPDNSVPKATINRVAIWLIETLAELLDSKVKFNEASREIEANVIVNHLLTKKDTNFQVLFEALNVYKSVVKSLDANQSLEALLDILDDSLEGYAIFPGSQGRRELFDWWLLEVVPASWYLFPPSYIYCVNKSTHSKQIASCQINELNQISNLMWSLIRESYKNRRNTNKDKDINQQFLKSTSEHHEDKIKSYLQIQPNQFMINEYENI
ncbi:MAG TPA: hypothetical protein V6D25_29455 [Leptolyngbyaceae cyanobacterium]